MDVYTNSGCHNNEQGADIAMSYIDNGTYSTYTYCSGLLLTQYTTLGLGNLFEKIFNLHDILVATKNIVIFCHYNHPLF